MKATFTAFVVPISLAFVAGWLMHMGSWFGLPVWIVAGIAQIYVLDGRDPHGLRGTCR